AEEQAVLAAMRSGRLSAGPLVARFEQEFATWLGSRHAVAVNSSSAAVHVALASLNAGPGDEVILSPLVHADTVSAVLLTGARPVFADVDPATLTIDPAAVEAAVTPRTVAVIGFHFAGHPCDVRALRGLCHAKHLAFVEDCSHALPTVIDLRACGTFGNAAVFSFAEGDTLSTGGGGMVVTDDSGVAARVRRLSFHGLERQCFSGHAEEHHLVRSATDPGYGYAMGEMAAAVGLVQLGRQSEFLNRRRSVVRAYREALTPQAISGDLRLPADHPGHAWRLFQVQTMERDRVAKVLLEAGIAVQIHFVPAHLQPAFTGLGYARGALPVAEGVAKRALSLPLHNGMEPQAARAVAAHLRFGMARRRGVA
ncbi:MAG: DegT/DnrJ/EryC1/StrS family aminotransferase, partial [Actinobacteria bacterium]|nr:DegT/DnrJ/EryC1/StrS family aminotransferase [Actinomycetota bacterium]